MPLIHIANTYFETELIEKTPLSVENGFSKHSVFRQLQFLPFLFADACDGVLVTHNPPDAFWHILSEWKINPPHLHLLSKSTSLDYERLDTWGSSRSVALWAKTHQLNYPHPHLDIVYKVQSKAFAHTCAPQIKGSALLYNEEQVNTWIAVQKGPSVLKTCFGTAGKGHHLISKRVNPDFLSSFLNREFQKQLPLIGEPWLDRILDFSTQWELSQEKEIHYIGETICNNSPKGGYRGTQVGSTTSLFGPYLSYLEEHKKIVQEILKNIAQLGYFGNIGVDAFLYKDPECPEKIQLHPVVEINARKTMGWVALAIQRRHFPSTAFSLHFSPAQAGDISLLPKSLSLSKEQKMVFHHGLSISFEKRLEFNDTSS